MINDSSCVDIDSIWTRVFPMQPSTGTVVPFEISDLTEDEISTAMDVKAKIDRHLLANDPSSWVYRGRSNVKFELTPSISHAHNWGGRAYRRADEIAIAVKFIKEVRPRYRYYSQLDILALGQHHSLPTRLLDWSQDIMVALYFAVDPERLASDIDGEVIMVLVPPHKIVRDRTDPFAPVKRNTVAFCAVAEFDLRIERQRGLFSHHPKPTVPWVIEDSGFTVRRLHIPGKAKRGLRQILAAQGLTKLHLLPDVQSICTKLARQLTGEEPTDGNVHTPN